MEWKQVRISPRLLFNLALFLLALSGRTRLLRRVTFVVCANTQARGWWLHGHCLCLIYVSLNLYSLPLQLHTRLYYTLLSFLTTHPTLCPLRFTNFCRH